LGVPVGSSIRRDAGKDSVPASRGLPST
jgi:hypothetical protein